MPTASKQKVTLGSFTLASGRPASQQVHDHLRREIISGRLLPGTSLSEANLCAHFGVSRQPVREALLRLSTQALIEIFPQRGSVVTRISVAMVQQAQLIREAVEVETLRRAIPRSTPDFLQELRNELTLQRAYIDVGDIARFFDSDQKFHRLICDQSGVPGIWDSLQQSRSQLDRARHAELETVRALPPLIEQHQAIVAGIEARDFERAEEAMRQHLRRITDNLDHTVAQTPDLFDIDVAP